MPSKLLLKRQPQRPVPPTSKKADEEDGPEETFIVSKTYEIWDEEAIDAGDTDQLGFEVEKETWDRSDVVRELEQGGYIHPSSSDINSLRWVNTEGDTNYTSGEHTIYGLHILNPDGSEIDGDQWASLLAEADLLDGMHLTGVNKKTSGTDEIAEAPKGVRPSVTGWTPRPDRTAKKAGELTHLTMTGPSAGATLCGAPRVEGCCAHPNLKALDKPEYRATVCPKCLSIWESDEDDIKEAGAKKAGMFKAIDGKEYKIDLLGAGYKCDAMKEYGYRTEKQCQNAINRKLKKRMDKSSASKKSYEENKRLENDPNLKSILRKGYVAQVQAASKKASKRLVTKVEGTKGTVKVYYGSDLKEYTAILNGEEKSTYFTNDKQDALDTATTMAGVKKASVSCGHPGAKGRKS